MSTQAGFALRGRNPDVLTCIANLSNDEVFTPPEFANQMLDTLAAAWAADQNGANIWTDKTVRFLDPCTKSGVFLREITSRLTNGLAVEIPDLDERVDHILTKQVFGIGITNLTSLLARRSVYCSKHANGKHSIAKGFDRDAGNIWFERTVHTWAADRCKFCGASKSTFDRGKGLETHAYALVHTDNVKTRVAELFGGNMQFDVIIGNPPYQLDDGGYGTSAAPIYHLFVEQAKKLEPRYLSLVIPSRWFAGGKGLDEFRESMLTDSRVRSINDYLTASEVFPGVGLKGGFVTSSGTGTILGPAGLQPILRTGPSRQPFVRFLKRAWTYSSASTKGCRSSRRSLLSRAGNRSRCPCLTISVSTDWLVPESRSG
jgi:Eco57I restriction-modification methylase